MEIMVGQLNNIIMKSVKVIFIVLETAMLLGVVICTFLTDWVTAFECGYAYLYQILIVLMSLCAVMFQREQQAIEWDDLETLELEDVEL